MGWLGQPIDNPESVTQVCELVIHQQDIRRAINRSRAIAPDLVQVVLDHSLDDKGGKSVNYAGKRVGGLALTATDMAWTFGTGAEVSGKAEAILMAVNGRDQAVADLTGPGVATLAQRTATWSARFADM